MVASLNYLTMYLFAARCVRLTPPASAFAAFLFAFASPRLVRFYEMEYEVPIEAGKEAFSRVRDYVERSGLLASASGRSSGSKSATLTPLVPASIPRSSEALTSSTGPSATTTALRVRRPPRT